MTPLSFGITEPCTKSSSRSSRSWHRLRLVTTFAVLVAAFVSPSKACLNDRDSDSLAEEARDLPDVVRVITGRFERNPPLYYEMRVKRVAGELKQQPRAFNLYDDIAVALDRLGRDDEAIRWIEQKRSLLPKYDGRNATIKEHWYRYYANVGTFWAHRWLRSGANRKRIAEMVRARDHIARALKIKPNAHFGREKYQLAAMEWIITPKLGYGSAKQIFTERTQSGLPGSPIEGLSGLIVLGNAWESVDVYHALANVIQRNHRRSSLSYLARLRMNELIYAGKKSLYPGAPTGEALKKLFAGFNVPAFSPNNRNDVEGAYRALRSEADQWQQARTSYMLARLQQGRHPDTDKTFWNEYRSSEPPTLEQFTSYPRWWRVFTSSGIYIGLLTLLLLGVLLLVLRDLRRKRKTKEPVYVQSKYTYND